MSGIEAAGIVLGSIPLIVTCLKSYLEGVETIKRYFKYKQELKSLLRSLQTEYDIFKNSIEEILDGLVKASKLTALLQDPGGAAWNDPKVEETLKRRLHAAYSGYLDTVLDMLSAVEEFQNRLKLKDGKIQISEGISFRHEYKRLKFSLSKSAYEDLMRRIRQSNQTLIHLTQQSLRLEGPRAKRHSRGPDFKRLRDCARSVYATIATGLRCCCRDSHTANLQLESRIGEVELDLDCGLYANQPRFRVLFSNIANVSTESTTPWSWEEADIRLLQNDDVAGSSVESATISTKKNKGVRFKDEVQVTVAEALYDQPDVKPIEDLCRMIRKLHKAQQEQCLGILVDEYTRQKHGVFAIPHTKSLLADRDHLSTISLKDVYLQQQKFRRQFTREDKLGVAITIASSVLQLCRTPWMNTTYGWSKEDILFIHSVTDGPIYRKPFVTTSFSGSSEAEQLEGQYSSLSQCAGNPVLFTLGILLIEVCFGKTLENLKYPDERGPQATDIVLEWKAINRLINDVYGEMGARYQLAVRRCISCDFIGRANNDMEDEQFQRAVYENVILLLEDTLRTFRNL